MSYDDKTLSKPPLETAPERWDSARHMAPDPSLPIGDQLAWYKVASHVLLLNASELCRRKAAAEADRALEKASALA